MDSFGRCQMGINEAVNRMMSALEECRQHPLGCMCWARESVSAAIACGQIECPSQAALVIAAGILSSMEGDRLEFEYQ